MHHLTLFTHVNEKRVISKVFLQGSLMSYYLWPNISWKTSAIKGTLFYLTTPTTYSWFMKNFPFFCRCFVGDGDDLSVEDCRTRDRDKRVMDPREISRSVSEMKEWVCSKIIKPDAGKVWYTSLPFYFILCIKVALRWSDILASSKDAYEHFSWTPLLKLQFYEH